MTASARIAPPPALAIAPPDARPDAPLEPEPTAAERRDRRLFRRSLAINFASLLGKGFWPLFIYLVPGWHGAAALGQFLLLAASIEVLQALCSTGFVDGLYRHVARLPGDAIDGAGYGATRLALRMAAGLGAAVALGAWLGGEALVTLAWGRPELAAPLQLMTAAIPLAGATSVLVATSSAAMRNEGEALIKHALVPAVTLACAWALAGTPHGALALAASYLLAQAIGLCGALALFARTGSLRRLLRWSRADDALIDARAQRRLGLLQGLGVMLWASVYSLDTLLLGAFVRDTQVALYRAGSELVRVLQYVRTQVSTSYLPLAGRYLRAGSLELLQRLLRELSLALCRSAFLLAGILAHLAPPLLRTMLPGQGGGEHGFVFLLLAGHLVVGSLALAGNTLVVAGQQRLLLGSSLAMSVVNLLVGAVLIPALGLAGAATATLAAMTVAMLGQAAALRTAVGVSLAYRPLLRTAALALLGYAASRALVAGLQHQDLLRGPWQLALAGALAFAAFFAAPLAPGLARRMRR